jgi:N-acetylglucosamine malate deacetylase 1
VPIRSDDEAIGMGGTIAKFVKQGKKVIKVVFSHGEKSIPLHQERFVKRERKKETRDASEFIGIKETIYLGLADTKVKKEVKGPKMDKKVYEIIKKYKPEKIFLPSALDIHPDHQGVHNKVLEVLDQRIIYYPVYAYEVWNIMKEDYPMVYEDISEFMKKKMDYIKRFKSQWMYMFTLYLPAYFRAKSYGNKIKTKFAERFYRIR